MRQALWTWASCAKKLRQRPFAWRHFHSTRSRQHLSGGLKPALRASPEFASLGGEPSIYLAWRLPIVRERATPTRWAEALLVRSNPRGCFFCAGFCSGKRKPAFCGFPGLRCAVFFSVLMDEPTASDGTYVDTGESITAIFQFETASTLFVVAIIGFQD